MVRSRVYLWFPVETSSEKVTIKESGRHNRKKTCVQDREGSNVEVIK